MPYDEFWDDDVNDDDNDEEKTKKLWDDFDPTAPREVMQAMYGRMSGPLTWYFTDTDSAGYTQLELDEKLKTIAKTWNTSFFKGMKQNGLELNFTAMMEQLHNADEYQEYKKGEDAPYGERDGVVFYFAFMAKDSIDPEVTSDGNSDETGTYKIVRANAFWKGNEMAVHAGTSCLEIANLQNVEPVIRTFPAFVPLPFPSNADVHSSLDAQVGTDAITALWTMRQVGIAKPNGLSDEVFTEKEFLEFATHFGHYILHGKFF